MRFTKYITELIRVNSGHSSKAFFLVSVTAIGHRPDGAECICGERGESVCYGGNYEGV